MNTWSIGHPANDKVTLDVAREYSDDCGYEWLAASVTIRAGAFSGSVDLSLLYSDLIRFYEQLEPLYRNLKGTAEFRTLEGQIEFDVSVDRTGHIELRGFLMDMAGIGNKLEFTYRFDQTDLAPTVRDLKICIGNIKRKEPNQALEPIRMLVTDHAFPRFARACSAPSTRMAHF